VLTITTALNPFGYLGGLSVLYQTLGGGAFATDGSAPSIIAVLSCAAPTFVFCYLFSDFLSEDLGRAGVYIFTRTAKRGAWLRTRLLQLGGFVCAYALFYCLLAGILLFFSEAVSNVIPGATALQSWQLALDFLLPAMGVNTLMLLALLIPICVFAIPLNPLACFMVIMAPYFASLLLCASALHGMAATLVSLLPTTQGVFAWHDTPFTRMMLNQGVIEGFSLAYSSGYLLVLLALETAISAAYIKRIELL
jgi:hypothetical protein